MDFFRGNSLSVILAIVLTGSPTCAWVIWQAPPTSADCTSPAPFADTQNCTCYYQCFQVNGLWQLIHLSCPSGGIWDDVYKSCVEGMCGAATTTTTTTTTQAPVTTTTTTQKVTTKPPVQTTKPTSSSPTQFTSARTSTQTTTATTKGPPITITSPQSSPPTSPQSSPPTSLQSSPPTRPSEFLCPSEGFFSDPNNCRGYLLCKRIRGRMYYYTFHCFIGSFWNSQLRRCIIGNSENCILEEKTLGTVNGAFWE